MANGDEGQTIKLRVQIDACVLEAEGPRDVVQGYFDAWRKLLPPRPGETPPPPPPPPPEDPLRRMFAVDSQRGLVALRVRPKTRHPEADAVLLLLYGHCNSCQRPAKKYPARA